MAMPSSDDAEKHWHDPEMLSSAITYAVSVVAVAALAFASYVFMGGVLAAVLVPSILFVGGVGAFVRTYQVWRAEGAWPIWQGAGWFLLALSLMCLAVPGTALQS